MVLYRADWVLPVSGPPIRDGWVSVEKGRVAGVGRGQPHPLDGSKARDLGRVAILPGLVNAHTHLELSYLHNAVPPGTVFTQWIREVMRRRREQPDPDGSIILEGVGRGIAEAVASGTALVGDISNTLVTVEPLARSALGGIVFYELIRFRGHEAEEFVRQAVERVEAYELPGSLKVSLAAHAPYSVGPRVFRILREHLDRRPLPASVHLAESAEEVEFVREGTGPCRAILEDVGAWDATWQPSGVSPVQYLDEHGFLDRRVLLVHGVQMSADDLARAADRGITLVTCPRSNQYTGAGVPPVARFYASGLRVAIGTDSLASTPDLNVFAELATLRTLAPEVPAAALIESATRSGAAALGFDADYGTIEPGKRARLLAVDVPAGTTDVEEYLVSGVAPQQVRWIGEGD